MAKKSSVEKNERRRRMVAQQSAKRAALKAIIANRAGDPEERFEAVLKVAALPRNASGRPRGYYRKFGLSRIALRDLASEGQVPGVVKSSW